MDVSTATGKLIAALKLKLKAKHLSYREVAAHLRVSEATVKRYFVGKGVTIEVLQRLAEIVDLDLLSLAIVAEDQSVVHRGMSPSQLAVIKRRGPLRLLFFQLLAGWTVEQISREFNLGSQMDGYPTKLENLGMIRRLSERGVKVLVRPSLRRRRTEKCPISQWNARSQFVRELYGSAATRAIISSIRFVVSAASALEVRKISRHFDDDRQLRRHAGLLSKEPQWRVNLAAAKRDPVNEANGPDRTRIHSAHRRGKEF